MTDNTAEHIQVHTIAASDMKLMATWTPEAQQALAEHIQEHLKVEQAKQMMRKIQAAQGVVAAQQMNDQGMTSTKPNNQKPGQNTGPGTKEEGVRGAGGNGTAPQPARQ